VPDAAEREWFDDPARTPTGERGLRFACTQCGNCCTGPTGFVHFTDDEARAMAQTLGITEDAFYESYTRDTPVGRSLTERYGPRGYDCVFLRRDDAGRALCSVYGARPEQCRTWPMWRSNLSSRRAWDGAAQGCPGMNTGVLHAPAAIRVTRERKDI